MSEFFTKEELCAYLAKKLVPCQLEFQIRKLSDKNRGYVYDRHLFGGYEICFNKNKLSPRMIYVNPETLAYEVCLENEESKKGTLPDKFLNLKDDYRKDRFKVLLDVLEVIASEVFSITCNMPEEIYDCSDEYQEIFNCRSHNPDYISMLISEDIDEILKRCENRYDVLLCDNLDEKEDKEIEQWTIYIEKNNFVCNSNAMDEDLKENLHELTSDYNNPPAVRKYKFRGRNGKVCRGFLFAWDVEELEITKKGKAKASVDILMEISRQHQLYCYYFNKKYIDSVVANNPDEFRKLLFILNSYGDEIGLKLVRVITESNNLVYQQQIKKYNELFESEFEALVADGKIISLTDKLYKLKIRYDVYIMASDQNSNSKEIDRNYFPCSGFPCIAKRLSEIWAESVGIPFDHINTYRRTRKICKIINDSLRIGELKLHDQLTQAIIEYSNSSVLLGTITLLCWNEVSLLLNKNYIETPSIDEIFPNETAKIETRNNAATIAEIEDRWESKAQKLALKKVLDRFSKWVLNKEGDFKLKLSPSNLLANDSIVEEVHHELNGSGFLLKEKPIEKNIEDINTNGKEIYLYMTDEGLFSCYQGRKQFYASHLYPLINGKNINQLISNKDFINIVFQKSGINAYFEINVPIRTVDRNVHWYNLLDLAALDNNFPKELFDILEGKAKTQEKMNRTGKKKKGRIER